jgi:hypothetical protein
VAEQEKFASIADASKPNAGRLYDYLLGGNHNFEVDRQAAKQLFATTPVAQKAARLVRWFLGEAVRRLSKEGFRYFLDFASGLPTVDHIHHTAAKGSKVLYSDKDRVTVSYGQEIIKDLPDVRYVYCEAEKPESILDSEEIRLLFGNSRKVAIGYSGVIWFLSDDEISHAMKTLCAWAENGSKLFITTETSSMQAVAANQQATEIDEKYKKMGQKLFRRNIERTQKIILPWKLLEPGFRPIEEWLDMSPTVAKELDNAMKGSGMYGAFFVKE